MQDYGHYTISFSREGNPQEVLDLIYTELDKLRNEPISEDELKSIKRFAINEYKEELINRERLAERLVEYELYMGGIGKYKTLPSHYKQVTAEDVIRVANKWMNIDKLIVARIAPK